ncbi:hypothetical protein [Pararhizobium gei]|uniref:hypothetical protein n=1 Tax=Pararhizobium gei TaxID=1395951 RepID=UPI0023DC1B39|nr:hypothetical protein [Rhizobium gei]
MPNLLGLAALAPPSLDEPTISLPNRSNFYNLGRAGLVPLHQWPVAAKNRAEFVQAICPNPHVSADLKKYVASVLDCLSAGRLDFMYEGGKKAQPIFDELDADEPDLMDQLRERGALPLAAFGNCLTPIVSPESVLWTADDSPINRGDLVAIAGRGMPMVVVKFFFGICGDAALFWCPRPDSLFAVRLDQILHVSKVVWLKEAGKPSRAGDTIDPRPHYTAMARHFQNAAPVAEWVPPPRFIGEFDGTPVSGLRDAMTVVHDEIADTMKALPA